jgi:hypothetical protein
VRGLARSCPCGGQGRGRTADLPLFRNSIGPSGQTRKVLAALVIGVSAGQQGSQPLDRPCRDIPQSSVLSVGFLWDRRRRGVVGILWGRENANAQPGTRVTPTAEVRSITHRDEGRGQVRPYRRVFSCLPGFRIGPVRARIGWLGALLWAGLRAVGRFSLGVCPRQVRLVQVSGRMGAGSPRRGRERRLRCRG